MQDTITKTNTNTEAEVASKLEEIRQQVRVKNGVPKTRSYRVPKAGIETVIASRVVPAVDQLREKYGVTDRPFSEDDFYRICEAEGIRLCNTEAFGFMAGCQELLGAVLTLPDGQRAIYVRGWHIGEPWSKIASTCWHELAHYLIHPKNGGMLLRKTNPSLADFYENEADAFSAMCLMHWA